MEPKYTQVFLSSEDWEEVCCALATKLVVLQDGEYGPPTEESISKWMDDLVRIESEIREQL